MKRKYCFSGSYYISLPFHYKCCILLIENDGGQDLGYSALASAEDNIKRREFCILWYCKTCN